MSYFRKGQNAPIRTGRAARTRVGNHMSSERRRDVLTRLTVRVNAAAGVLTVADALRERGADADLIRRYASPVGRKMAAAYRAATAAEPAQTGLAVAGHRLVHSAGYTAADRAMLDAVIDGYEMRDPAAPKTGKAERVRLLDVIAQPVETVAPASLVADLAQRHEVPAGHVARRVAAIVDGMRGNPRLYDPAGDTLTEAGARVVRSVIHAEDLDGMLQREAQARQEAQRPDTRVLVAA